MPETSDTPETLTDSPRSDDAFSPPPQGQESPPVAETPADAQNAEADLARPARAQTYRAGRRARLSMSIIGLLLVGVGGLLLYETLGLGASRIPAAAFAVIGLAALGVGIFTRFALNGRRERGLAVIGLSLIGWAGAAYGVWAGQLPIGAAWPLGISLIGVALLVAFALERGHDRGVVLPALAMIGAGVVALPFGMGNVSPALMQSIALFWPVLLLIGAALLLPRAFPPRDG
jgi:hypothetical protein